MIKKTYTIRDFLPLIGVLSFITLFSVALVLISGESLVFGVRIFMGTFFLVFGVLKLIHLNDFADAYQMYDIIAARFKGYGYGYPFLEVALGVGYILGVVPLLTHSATLILMLIGAFGVYRTLGKKENIPCVCLGTIFTVPVTWVTLCENLLMAGMALGMLWMTVL